MSKVFRLIGRKGRTTVPFEIRVRMKLGYNSLISYEVKDDDTVILRREKVCDGCKDQKVKEGSILDVINSLSATEQKATFHYLAKRLSETGEL